MPKIYEYDEKELYYTAEPRSIGITERLWLDNLKVDILKHTDVEHNILVNITWFRGNMPDLVKFLNYVISISQIPEEVKIWFSGTVDGMDWFIHFPLVPFLQGNRYKVSFVGFAKEHWHSWMPNWFYNYNININEQDLKLSENFKYKFLSYNRKPREHRLKLVSSIINLNLLEHGWVTFDNDHFAEVDKLSGESDQNLHTSDLRWSRPENLTSLGDLERWNNSYAIIVSETEIFDSYQISEKTWKPIFGLRPFLLNANVGVTPLLKKLGFYTPDVLFQRPYLNGDTNTVIQLLMEFSKMSNSEIYKMYQNQLPMLIHNRNRFIEIATMDQTNILNWSQAKSL